MGEADNIGYEWRDKGLAISKCQDPEVSKTLFMLNSAEHEFYNTHNY